MSTAPLEAREDLQEPIVGHRLVDAAPAVLVATISMAIGVVLAFVGASVGPLFMFAVPAGILAAIAVLVRPWVGLVVLFLIYPVGYITIPAGGVEIELVQIAAALVTGLLMLRRLGSGATPLPWAPQMWWAFMFVAWALVATPSALDQKAALTQDVLIVIGFLLALAVLAACRTIEEARWGLAFLLVVGSGLVATGLSSLSELRAAFEGAVVAKRPRTVFDQPNDLGAFAAVVFMVGIGLSLGARLRWTRILAGLATAVALTSLIVSLSRGAWIGTAIASVFLLWILPEARRTAVRFGLPAVIILAAVFGVVLPDPPPQIQVVQARLSTLSNPLDNPYDDRPAIWAEAMREIREDPLTGQGPGSFLRASSRSRSLAQTVGALHAHNTLLTVAAETGLPNVFFLMGFTVSIGLVVIRSVRRLLRPRDRALVAGVGAALLALVGQGLVDFNLRNPLIFIVAWTLVGTLLVAERAYRAEREEAQ